MKSNREELIKQFVLARGIERVDLSSQSFLQEFSNWLKERKKVGEKYISFISSLGLFKDNSKCAEINKGIDDSVTLPYHTRLITPYIDIDTIGDSQRIINANFSVNKQYTTPIISTQEITMKVISNREIKTYMTQNPYNTNMLEGWSHLHNSKYNNIVVGVYGKEYDKDKATKKDMLLRLRKQLNNNFKEVEYVFNDDYLCVIGSKENKTR